MKAFFKTLRRSVKKLQRSVVTGKRVTKEAPNTESLRKKVTKANCCIKSIHMAPAKKVTKVTNKATKAFEEDLGAAKKVTNPLHKSYEATYKSWKHSDQLVYIRLRNFF